MELGFSSHSLDQVRMAGFLKLSNLRAERILFRPVDVVKLREGESLESGFIIRDGQVYLLQGSTHTRIVQVAHNKDLHRE